MLTSNTKSEQPYLLESLLPFALLILLLGGNVYLFGSSSSEGANQVALMIVAGFATAMGLLRGCSWDHIQRTMVKNIGIAMPAVFIVLIIGALSGSWLLSGVVPSMIYYGLKILSPAFFLPATFVLCIIVSSATGSSWSTVSTIGVALLGVGRALGWTDDVITGAIISGAYVGDKLSPLSDTTTLAASTAGAPLFGHVKHMMWTTIPAVLLSLLLFIFIGFTKSPTGSLGEVARISEAVRSTFYISPILFIILLLVGFLVFKKVDSFPALLLGSILGGVAALIFQRPIIQQIAGVENLDVIMAYKAVIKAMACKIQIHTGDPTLDKLLTSGGMAGVVHTVWLIIAAMMFGGAMEATGMLGVIVGKLAILARSSFGLITTTVGTCGLFSLTIADQHLSIMLPGKMFAGLYKKAGLKAENLSRTLEDTATVVGPMIPWNVCGALHTAALGVATAVYVKYCFFCMFSPLMAILFALFNIKVTKIKQSEEAS